MRLPNAEQAIIPPAKLRDYLLNEENPRGRPKAVFLAKLGFRREQWMVLEAALRADHLTADAEEVQGNQFGRKFRIVAPIMGPPDETAIIKSIWIVRHGEDIPRLVTAYPE